MIIKTIVKKIIDLKFYLNRANSYISMLNTGMLLMLFVSKLNEYGFNISLKNYGILLFVLSLLVFVFIGYLDEKFGVAKYENSRNQLNNSEIQEILKILKEKKI